jgi:hypothetical protein
MLISNKYLFTYQGSKVITVGGGDIVVFNDIRTVSVIFNMLVQIVHTNS